jgi:hypothetical protein
VFVRVHSWLKIKNPTAGWQWGSINLVNKSEPDRRATQQQRVKQQIQIAVHAIRLRAFGLPVKCFLSANKRRVNGFSHGDFDFPSSRKAAT